MKTTTHIKLFLSGLACLGFFVGCAITLPTTPDDGNIQTPASKASQTIQTSSKALDICTPTPEICNNKDDDCDGLIDEGIDTGIPCYTQCGVGTQICKAGTFQCSVPLPVPEDCNGKDDNCDGQIDEGLTYQPCQTLCSGGWKHCKQGVWTTCTATQPKPEECNGKDDDCNGLIDDGLRSIRCTRPDGFIGLISCINGHWTRCQ